jgi:serine/threonine protein kinase
VKLKIAVTAARGVIYLHNHKRVHRHLTSHNFLIDQDYTAKVTDFGTPPVLSSPWFAPPR